MNNSLLTALQQAFKALSRNIGRTILTMLGIVIGITTVILVLTAGAGFRSLINSVVDSWGSNTLFIETKVPPTTKDRAAGASQDINAARSGVVITSLKQRDLDEIKKLPNVANAYGMVSGVSVVSYRNNKKSTIYYGAAAERFQIDKNPLKAGHFYTEADDAGGAQVVILGSSLAQNLFGQEDPIGKLVRVGTLNFQVAGVYEPQGALGGSDDLLYMPLVTAQKKMLGIDHLLFGIVQLRDTDQGGATAEQIRQVLRGNHHISDSWKDDFSVQTQAQALETFNTIFGGITALLIAIAAISLVVGGVGIMNIMYVVVTERTAEIGLKKALGAQYKDILSEFLVEAVVVTILGGALGILLGAGLGWIVAVAARSANLDWSFVVPPYAIALGFGVSAVIGILFGVLPARSAAKLDPIEALRYE